VKPLRDFLEMLKFEHTIFALPFAYLGMLLAAGLLVAAAGEDKTPPRPYTVSGERHGVSFFPAVDYPETKPL